MKPIISECVHEQRAEHRQEQQRRRVAARRYAKQRAAEQYRRKQAAMSDSEREADIKTRSMQTKFATAEKYAKTQAARNESAQIRADLLQPLAVKARELCLASREAGKPMEFDEALRLVRIRSKQRYAKPRSEQQLLQAATKYVEKQRAQGRNLPLMTALKHVKLGLV